MDYDKNSFLAGITVGRTLKGWAGIGGGGGGSGVAVRAKDVNFYDYDGTLLHSYTVAESAALTSLPALPSHDGLVCQGWNWTLNDIKAMGRAVNVGAMYITDDGATRLHIRIATVGRMTVPLYIGQTVENGVSIDWGDGSAAETLTGTGNVNTSHTYAKPGDYVISLTPEDGCTLSFGSDSSSYCVMGLSNRNGLVYCNMLQDVYIGRNVTSISNDAFFSCYSLSSITIPDGVTSIGNYAFHVCSSLASITIPDGVTSIGIRAFGECSSLASISIPDGVTSIGNYAFYYCRSLASIIIPDGVTSIGEYAFYVCSSLSSITIPDGVTSIGRYTFDECYSLAIIIIPDGVTSIRDHAFNYCYGVAEYHLKPTKPPALSNTNAFLGIQTDCIIYVPKGCLSAYQAAKNWSTYARYMQEEP